MFIDKHVDNNIIQSGLINTPCNFETKGYTMKESIVTINHATTCSDTPEQLKGEESTVPRFEHHFDFSNCSEKEILDMAATNMVIVWRARNSVKGLTEDDVRALPTEIDVKEFLASTKTRGKSVSEKAENLIDKMSDADRAKLLADLTEKYTSK